MKPEKTPAFGLPVTTKPNKQWQRSNLYRRFIQMGDDPRIWWVQTLTDHLPFSFQANVFIARNKQGAVRALRLREDWAKEAATFPSWAVSCSQGRVVVCLSLGHRGPDASSCPQVIFSGAPGGQLFSQEPGQALSIVSETKALTYTSLARLITFYLKLKFSNFWVPYHIFIL